MENIAFGENGLPINDAVPAPTRIMPGNEFLWNWRAMQEYAQTAIKAINADADAAEEVLGVAAAEQCIRAENAEAELQAVREAMPIGLMYLDPPDGGDVPIGEQIRRMGEDARRYAWLRQFYGSVNFEPEDCDGMDLVFCVPQGEVSANCDKTVDALMEGANTEVKPTREAGSA